MARPKAESGDHTSVGNKVGILRRDQKLTQAQMAAIMDVSRGTISSYEGRSNASPSPRIIKYVADYFYVDIGWFYDGKDSPPKYFAKPQPGTALTSDFEDLTREGAIPEGFVTLRASTPGPNEYPIYRETYELSSKPPVELVRGPWEYRLLIVAGDELSPRAPEGSAVYFRKDGRPPYGSLVVARETTSEYFRAGVLFRSDGGQTHLQIPGLERMIPTDYVLDIWGAAEVIVRPYSPGAPNLEYNGGEFLL